MAKIRRNSPESEQIKVVAKCLFVDLGWSLNRISEHLNATFATIQHWCESEKWERNRSENEAIGSNIASDLRAITAKQVTAVRKRLELSQEADDCNVLENKEIDGITKLISLSKATQPQYADFATILIELTGYITRLSDLDTATKNLFGDVCDQFLATKQAQQR
jgi:hypothetical protein